MGYFTFLPGALCSGTPIRVHSLTRYTRAVRCTAVQVSTRRRRRRCENHVRSLVGRRHCAVAPSVVRSALQPGKPPPPPPPPCRRTDRHRPTGFLSAARQQQQRCRRRCAARSFHIRPGRRLVDTWLRAHVLEQLDRENRNFATVKRCGRAARSAGVRAETTSGAEMKRTE